MMVRNKLFRVCLILILTASFLGGCVSNKKFHQVSVEKDNLEQKAISYSIELAKSKNQNTELIRQLNELKDQNFAVAGENKRRGQELQQLKSSKVDLNRDYDILKAKYQDINEYFQIVLNDCDRDKLAISQRDKELREREENLKKLAEEQKQKTLALAERESATSIVEKHYQNQSEAAKKIYEELKRSIAPYFGKGIDLAIKNDKVFLSLDETLVFDQGSLNINDSGTKVLGELAIALNAQPNIDVIIQGNTDRIKISKKAKYLTDNWDLSVLRATAVTRALTEAKLDPTIVTAAGRASFNPTVSNNTEEGREKNKRTDIIVMPKLDNSKNFSIN
ncbi:MAG: OmpA family protein [Cyclobacteriaceae bacterium]